MANIQPFKAVRPTRDKVSLVASRSYQSYTTQELEARLDYNPFSFLHIINPGYKYQKEIEGIQRYKLVSNRYLEFKEEKIFVQEDTPAYYVYKIIDRNEQSFCGIIAAASTKDYDSGTIKKHEDTIEHREKTFKKYLKTVGFNAEPVLLTHADNSELETFLDSITKERSEYEFTTTYKDTHYLWVVKDKQQIQKIQSIYQSMDTIYIADGHHRCASSCLLSKHSEKKENIFDSETYHYFMSYLIPESNIKTYAFDRLVTDLNGIKKEEFLIRLDEWFRIENLGQEMYTPQKSKQFCMYLDGEFYSLQLRLTNYKPESLLDQLDTQILYKTILNPILGILDPRQDKRIAYSQGKSNLLQMKTRIDRKEFAVGFALFPSTISQIKKIADQGFVMPPKSTYIEPKLRSGITIYEF